MFDGIGAADCGRTGAMLAGRAVGGFGFSMTGTGRTGDCGADGFPVPIFLTISSMEAREPTGSIGIPGAAQRKKAKERITRTLEFKNSP